MVGTTATVINSFLMIGGFLATVVGTLGVMRLVDRFCSAIPLITESGYTDHGEVARAAGLRGMRIEERIAVLKKILLGVPFHDGLLDKVEKTSDENVKNNLKKNDQSDNGRCNIHCEKSASDEENPVPLSDELSSNSTVDTSICDRNIDTSINCIICLEDYAHGENLIKSIHCPHIFHEDCIMEWLEKHDVCPVCRIPMVTPEEFKKAAVATLDASRIDFLVRAYGQEAQYKSNSDIECGNVTQNESLRQTEEAEESV